MIPHSQQIGQGQPVFHQNAGCISAAFFWLYTISSPLTGLCALGWSMLNPSMSHRYCCGVSARASLSLRGHWKLPDSKRLYSSTKPLPSQYSALIRSRRRPHEQKQRVAEWIQFKFQLHQRRQAVDSLAKVGVPAADVHLLDACEVAQHDFTARSTASTVAASAPLWMAISTSPI